MDREIKLFLFKKIIVWIRAFLWRAKKFLYINSNVKQANVARVKEIINCDHLHVVNCQSNKSDKLRSLKHHFYKMRAHLAVIQKNIDENECIFYTGFSSQMFSMFDGFILGDTNSYQIIDYDGNNYYTIDFKPVNYKKNFEIIDCKEINIIISSSYDISISKCENVYSYIFDKKAPKTIDCAYLNEVRNFVKEILDSYADIKISCVNIYISAKNSVSFAVGTAIQSYHPNVKIYEYRGNNFAFYLDLSKQKIFKVNHD